jgi:hypothetical protein
MLKRFVRIRIVVEEKCKNENRKPKYVGIIA